MLAETGAVINLSDRNRNPYDLQSVWSDIIIGMERGQLALVTHELRI